MRKITTLLLMVGLVMASPACTSSKDAVSIPPGKYVNKDKTVFVPSNTDLTKEYQVYVYRKGKYYPVFTLQNSKK
jgi:hypothetical protein